MFNIEYSNLLPIVKEYWLIIVGITGAILIAFNKLFYLLAPFGLKRAIALRNFKAIEKYFSKTNLAKLEKEPEILKTLATYTVPIFNGLSYNEVKQIVNADIKGNNPYTFIKLYKSNYLNLYGEITEKGDNFLKRWKRSISIYIGFFGAFTGLFSYFVEPYKYDNEKPLFIILWLILLLVFEAYILNYYQCYFDLDKFKYSSVIGEKNIKQNVKKSKNNS